MALLRQRPGLLTFLIHPPISRLGLDGNQLGLQPGARLENCPKKVNFRMLEIRCPYSIISSWHPSHLNWTWMSMSMEIFFIHFLLLLITTQSSAPKSCFWENLAPQRSFFVKKIGPQQHCESHFFGTPCICKYSFRCCISDYKCITINCQVSLIDECLLLVVAKLSKIHHDLVQSKITNFPFYFGGELFPK